jgi:formate dehydrogenase maturation protein FdhE
MDTPECPRCGSLEFHDVTTIGERPGSSLMCAECGTPWHFIPFRAAPCMGKLEGPSVPTPEQLLAHAFGGWLS